MADNETTIRDILATLGGGTAIGLGVRKWYQRTSFRDVIAANRIPGSEKAFSAARRAIQSFKTGTIKKVERSNEEGLARLIKAIDEGTLSLSAEDVKSVLLQSAEYSDPSGAVTRRIAAGIEEGMSATQILEDVMGTARETSSIYYQRTVSSFLGDISGMEGLLAQGKSLVPTSLAETDLFATTSLHPGRLASRGELPNVLRQIEEELKAKMTLRGRARTVPGVGYQGKELLVSFFDSPFLGPQRKVGAEGRKVPQLTLTIPLSVTEDPSIVVRGATGQSAYIAGEFWELEKQISGQFALRRQMRYEEWAARRFLEENVHRIIEMQRLSRREVYNIQQAFHQNIHKGLDWIENLTPGLHPAHDEYVRMRKQIARLAGPGGRELTDLEYASIIEHGVRDPSGKAIPVYPSASPTQMARSVVSLQDWRGLGLFGEAWDWGRRPLQGIREEFTPSAFALFRMKKSRLMQEYSWAMRQGGAPSPLVRTLFVSSERAQQLAAVGMNVEGSGLLSTAKLPMFAQEEIVRYKIASKDIYGLKDVLGNLEQTQWSLNNAVVQRGTVLGRDPSGRLITVGETFKALEAVRYQDKNLQDFIRLVGTRTHEEMDWFKVFGDAKAMMRTISQEQLNASIGYALGGDLGYGLPIHAMVTMDELRKNRSLHYKQIFTSLHEFTKANFNRGLAFATNFNDEPANVLAAIERGAKQFGAFQHEYVLSEAYQLARAANLTPTQMGGVFGAVPEVFGLKNVGEEWLHLMTTSELVRRSIREGTPITREQAAIEATGLLANPETRARWAKRYGISAEEAVAIGRKAPIGLAQFAFGGRYGPGSGKRGTIEPRFFELLSSPHLGTLGPSLQEDIANRMLSRYGFRLEEQEELARSISTMLEPKGKAGILPSHWTPKMFQEGGLLQVPNIGDIRIPSAQSISQLASYRTPAGIEVKPRLGITYELLIEDAMRLQAGAITEQEMRASIDVAREEVQRAHVATIMGKEGVLRGRLMGSRFFTAVPIQPGVELARNEIGITEEFANMMLADLEEVYGKEAVDPIRGRLLAGEAVGSMTMRHPAIGPYSAAATMTRLIKGRGPVAMFGEQFMEATLMGPTPQKIGAIRVSPAIGMAMDYDADIVSNMFLVGENERRVAAASLSEDYDVYAIRSQLLKAKKAAGKQISIHEAAAGAALRLRVPKERLGLISESLQVARASMLASGRETSRVTNALGLLEWLEQAPISAKHIAAGEEKSMVSLFANIRQSIINRDAEMLAQSALSIVGKGTIGEQFLRQGGTVKLAGPGGELKYVNVPGIDVERAARDIVEGIGEFEFKGIEGVSPARIRQLIRGRGAAASAKESELLVRHGIQGVSPFGSFFQTVDAPGATAALTRELGATRNKIAAAGGRLLEHARPIAIGAAAAVAIGMVLSRPPKMMNEADLESPRPRLKKQSASEKMSPETVPTVAGRTVVGSPTVDNAMEGANTVRIMPTASHLTVRARSTRGVDYSMLNSQLSQVAGGARVSSRIVDNRMSLSSQRLSKIVNEE